MLCLTGARSVQRFSAKLMKGVEMGLSLGRARSLEVPDQSTIPKVGQVAA